MAKEEWHSCIENHHDAYISIEDYQTNCSILASNNTRKNASAPREGNALLQGIVICAACGKHMNTAYKKYKGDLIGTYQCVNTGSGAPFAHSRCICIGSRTADQAVEAELFKRLTPQAVRCAYQVQEELEKRKNETDHFFAMQVEKARYESELARKRYMNADPENRLVCSELERLWNEKMNILFKREMEQKRHEKENMAWTPPFSMDELYQFPEKLKEAWCGRHLDMTTKKRILRCLIQDITLSDKMGMIQVGIRFHTGAEELIEVGRPLKKYETWTTSPELVDYIRAESRRHTVEEITAMLNDMGKKSGKGKPFTLSIVRGIQYHYKIPSLKQHLKSIGYLTTEEKAKELGITPNALNKRRSGGTYHGEVIKTTSSGDYMYKPFES